MTRRRELLLECRGPLAHPISLETLPTCFPDTELRVAFDLKHAKMRVTTR